LTIYNSENERNYKFYEAHRLYKHYHKLDNQNIIYSANLVALNKFIIDYIAHKCNINLFSMATDIQFIKKQDMSKAQDYNRKSIYNTSFLNIRKINIEEVDNG
jgi:hypothetical protein